MAVDFGKLVVGGKEHHHPLTSEQIKFLLTILKTCDFKGEELENLMVIVMKLQEEYTKVLKKEQSKRWLLAQCVATLGSGLITSNQP